MAGSFSERVAERTRAKLIDLGIDPGRLVQRRANAGDKVEFNVVQLAQDAALRVHRAHPHFDALYGLAQQDLHASLLDDLPPGISTTLTGETMRQFDKLKDLMDSLAQIISEEVGREYPPRLPHPNMPPSRGNTGGGAEVPQATEAVGTRDDVHEGGEAQLLGTQLPTLQSPDDSGGLNALDDLTAQLHQPQQAETTATAPADTQQQLQVQEPDTALQQAVSQLLNGPHAVQISEAVLAALLQVGGVLGAGALGGGGGGGTGLLQALAVPPAAAATAAAVPHVGGGYGGMGGAGALGGGGGGGGTGLLQALAVPPAAAATAAAAAAPHIGGGYGGMGGAGALGGGGGGGGTGLPQALAVPPAAAAVPHAGGARGGMGGAGALGRSGGAGRQRALAVPHAAATAHGGRHGGGRAGGGGRHGARAMAATTAAAQTWAQDRAERARRKQEALSLKAAPERERILERAVAGQREVRKPPEDLPETDRLLMEKDYQWQNDEWSRTSRNLIEDADNMSLVLPDAELHIFASSGRSQQRKAAFYGPQSFGIKPELRMLLTDFHGAIVAYPSLHDDACAALRGFLVKVKEVQRQQQRGVRQQRKRERAAAAAFPTAPGPAGDGDTADEDEDNDGATWLRGGDAADVQFGRGGGGGSGSDGTEDDGGGTGAGGQDGGAAAITTGGGGTGAGGRDGGAAATTTGGGGGGAGGRDGGAAATMTGGGGGGAGAGGRDGGPAATGKAPRMRSGTGPLLKAYFKDELSAENGAMPKGSMLAKWRARNPGRDDVTDGHLDKFYTAALKELDEVVFKETPAAPVEAWVDLVAVMAVLQAKQEWVADDLAAWEVAFDKLCAHAHIGQEMWQWKYVWSLPKF